MSVGTLNNGSIFPPEFTVHVQASGDSFVATLPSISWSIGPTTFDSAATVEIIDSNIVFVEYVPGSAHPCDFILVGGNANAARDTIHSAIFMVGDTDNTGVYICKPKAQGSVTITKS